MRVLRQFLLSICCALFLAGAGAAQEAGTVDMDRWNRVADTVADALDNQGSTTAVLDALRRQVSDYRARFDSQRGLNADRIAVLRRQLAALGPEPSGDGAVPEAPEVAAQRADLSAQLATLLAPVQKAEAEFLRADVLIGQIDQLLRERNTERLLTVGPSPLNPANWQPAFQDIGTSLRLLWAENATTRANRQSRDLYETIPIAAGLALLGLLLIFRGRTWSNRIVGQLRKYGARGFGVWRFVVSLLRIMLPFAGFVLLVLAVVATELFGPKGEQILYTIAVLSGIMLGYRWVSDRVFSRDDDEALLALAPEKRAEVRFHVSVITVLLAFGVIAQSVLEAGSPAAASAAVLQFPFFVLAALPLFRIGVLLRGYADPLAEGDTSDETRSSTLRRLVRWLGLGAIIVALAAPLLAAAGYFEAARAIFTPYVVTLVLLGLVMALQRFLADVYGAITGQGAQARDALLPVLIGLALLIVVSPVIALAWGARVTDLTELWQTVGRGFAIGETRISPTNFLTFAVIFAIGYVLTRLIQSSLRTNVLPKTKIDIGGQNAIVSGLGYVGIFLAALAAITGAGIDLSSLAIVAGALSVGIGFGLQNIVSNFVSGIILLIERPISEGDWIEVSGGQMGYVRDISVRSTRIETFDRTDVIVPNADLVSGTVTNYTRGNTVGRVIVSVGVAYGTDAKMVEGILREIAEAQPMVLAVPPPSILFVNFGADALEFEVRCFLRDVNWMMMVKNDINHAIAARFAEAGIEIPFAQRDLWLRNPEALRSNSTEGEA